MIGRKTCLLLSLGAALCFLLILLLALPAPEPGQVRTAADPAPSEAILTGRDEPGRVPLELLPGQTVDINRATAEELQRLPGIGEALAGAIIDYREANGPFESPQALTDVPGIGPGRYEAVAGLITAENP